MEIVLRSGRRQQQFPGSTFTPVEMILPRNVLYNPVIAMSTLLASLLWIFCKAFAPLHKIHFPGGRKFTPMEIITSKQYRRLAFTS